MRLKRLISAFITCAMLVTLMPMQAFAAPKDIFNDTEFHIMQMDEIKNFVREANNLFNDADIKIYGINVHGLDKNGKPATVNGNITDWTKWNTTIGDLGWQGSNGKLANDDWMVLNINGITVLDQSSVDSITIFAKNDKNQLTTTAYLGEGDLHAPTQVSGKLITEIYLNNATPVPQFTLTYDANGGTGKLPEATLYPQDEPVTVNDGAGLTRDKAVFLGFSETQKDPITQEADCPELLTEVTMTKDTTLYAVWAQDENKNGEPDYEETKYTVTYNDGVEGEEVFKDEVHENLLWGTDTPAYNNGTNPTREGYIFDGWDPKVADTVTENATYAAQWKKESADTITVNYVVDANQGEVVSGGLTETATIAADGTVILDVPKVEGKDGGYFKNLFTGWTCEGANVTSDNGIYTLEGVTAGESYTLTAKFIQDEYMIFAKASENGKIRMAHGHGTGNEAQVEYTSELTDGQIKITRSEMAEMKAFDSNGKQGFVYIEAVPNDPTKYGFAGWDDIHISGPEKSSENPFYVSNLNESYKYSLTATFNPLINVTFDAGEHGQLAEGQENNQTVVSDYWASNILFPELVVEDGYKLTGWKNNKDDKVYDGPINNISVEWDGAIFTAQYEEIQNPIKEIDITIGENLAKEIPNLNKCDILHAEYGDQYILLSGGDGHFTTPLISEIWHSIPDSLTTAVDTVEEAKEFFNGFTAINTNIFNSWKKWLENDVILNVRVDGTTLYMTLDKKPTTKEITLNIYDIVNGKQVEERTMTVAVDATSVNTSDITLPADYEFTVTGDLPINDNNVYVEVRPIAQTKEVTLNIYDIVNHEQVKEEKMTVAADAIHVNTGDIDLPEGYEFTVTGDLPINDNNVYVEVKPVEKTKDVTLNIYDIVNHKQVEEQTMAVAADAIHVNTGDINLPEGYEFTVTGDLPIRDNNVYVEVRPVETGKAIVNIRFMDGDEFVAGGDYPFEDGESVQFGDLELPEGYELDTEKNNEESGFVAKDGVQIIVHVKKAETDVIMNIRFVDEDTGEFVAGGDYFLPAGVQNYSILEEYVPEGYRMAVSGEFMAVDGGKLEVPLEKEETVKYSVTVNGSYANHSGEGKYAPGETVTIKAGTRDNYSFDGWESDDVDFEDADDSTTTFIMPAWDVTVRATWDRDSGGGAHHPDAGDDNDDDNDRDDDTEEIIDEEVPLAETPWLNTEDHYAYVVGYSEDGTVRPNANITRAEVATIFFRLLTDNARDQFWMTSNNFSDVLPNDWYNSAVSTMVNMGIIQGYEDGTFRPNANITRAEFATIAARFLASGYEVEDDLFGDIAAHWARESINDAAMAGWINGYEDGTFRPDAAITRAEAVTMVNNVLGRKPDADHMLDSMIKWTDNMDTSAWYYEAIQEATNSHDYDLFEGAEYETWTALQENRDWSALEKDWANAHVA